MTTKFDINQNVFYLDETGIHLGNIWKIEIESSGRVKYHICNAYDHTNQGTRKEQFLAIDKYELINKMRNSID